jgi:chromate reductase
MKILFIPGSLRKESFNMKLLEMAAKDLNYATDSIVSAEEMNLPLYSGDIESIGIPTSVQNLASKITEANAIIIASPEYN